MLGIISYTLATNFLLLGLYLIEKQSFVSRFFVVISGAGYLLTASTIIISNQTPLRYLLALTVAWHIWNLLPVWKRHFTKSNLWRRILASWASLSALNAAVFSLVVFDTLKVDDWLGWGSVIASSYVLFVIASGLGKTEPKRKRSLENLPTVSLLVPARNEDHALTNFLHNALTLTYPKLEVIVLDDCSHDKTPDIIKDFARSGVHFLKGKTPPEGTLGKNYAQHQLAQKANGEVYIFADVDVRFKPESVEAILGQMDSKTGMVSILPFRNSDWLLGRLLSPLFPLWQIVVSRNFLKEEPVSLNCNAIRSDVYRALGGHDQLLTKMCPEKDIAGFVKRSGLGYKFLISDKNVGITTKKKLSSQEETLVRVLYPLAGSNPGNVLWIFLGVSAIFLLPAFNFLIHPSLLSAFPWVLFTLVIAYYHTKSVDNEIWVVILFAPAIVLHELLLLAYSMFRYETASVSWKERNICYPQLYVVPELPPPVRDLTLNSRGTSR